MILEVIIFRYDPLASAIHLFGIGALLGVVLGSIVL